MEKDCAFQQKTLSARRRKRVSFLVFYQLLDLVNNFRPGRGFVKRRAGPAHFLQTFLVRQQVVNSFRAGGALLDFNRHIIVNEKFRVFRLRPGNGVENRHGQVAGQGFADGQPAGLGNDQIGDLHIFVHFVGEEP